MGSHLVKLATSSLKPTERYGLHAGIGGPIAGMGKRCGYCPPATWIAEVRECIATAKDRSGSAPGAEFCAGMPPLPNWWTPGLALREWRCTATRRVCGGRAEAASNVGRPVLP